MDLVLSQVDLGKTVGRVGRGRGHGAVEVVLFLLVLEFLVRIPFDETAKRRRHYVRCPLG